MFTLIKNVNVFSPEPLGNCNILICNDRIVYLSSDNKQPEDMKPMGCKVIDGKGACAIPGIIDQHEHIIGGGGEDGYESSIDPIASEECLRNGVTTIVGVLGTDSVTKSVRQLVAQTKKLNHTGLTAYCLTGAYAYPSPTITGSVTDDIVFVEEILGVKLAIADHRSFYPAKDEILRLAAQARNAGLISGKPGIIHLHIGNEIQGMRQIFDIVENTSFPIEHFRPTHMEKNLEDAVRFADLGGYIDFTACDDTEKTAQKIIDIVDKVPLDRITISSDANGSVPVWRSDGTLEVMKKSSVSSMLQMVRLLKDKHGLPLEKALRFMTSNVSEGLKLKKEKGYLKEGCHADIVLLTPDLQVRDVFAKGVHVVSKGRAVSKQYYSKEECNGLSEKSKRNRG